jgi:hypothetical protein
MLRSARSKIANSVSKIEITDDFQFAKWLRPSQIYKEEIYPLVSYDDTEELNIEKFEDPSSIKIKFKFQSISVLSSKPFLGVVKPRAYLIFFGLTRPQLFQMKENFLKVPDLTDLKSKLLVSQEVIDQSNIFIVQPAPIIKYDYDFFDSISNDTTLVNEAGEIDSAQNYIEVPKEDQLNKIPIPDITDHLASLIPEIYNIELLNDAKLENIIIDSRKLDVKQLKLPIIDKIEVPEINDILESSAPSYSVPLETIIKPEIKYFSSEIDFSAQVFKVKIDLTKTIVKKVIIKQNNFDTIVLDGLNDEKISVKLRENVRALLSSYRELSWEEYSKSIIEIKPYESEGAKFLTENNFAVYSEELGYEKFLQSISALNFLFRKGKVKTALIISEEARINDYWQINLAKYGKGLSPQKIDAGTNTKIFGYSIAWLLNIDDLGKIDLENFSQIDLVIFDEQINLKSASNILDELIKKVEPHFIWFLTAIVNQKHNKKFLENFAFSSEVDFSFWDKSLADIQQEEPVVFYKDFWLQLDEMQSIEYAEAFNDSCKELSKLVKSYNPIRFQSSIFTLIHKLKQILNFSSFRNISPKANLLIEHAQAIYHNKKKAIVFTQYDVNGMKKIEKAFEMNNIKHIVARNGMSAEELKNSLKSFYSRKEVPILLTNLKPSRLDINLSKVSYILNFDQWWNPITNWQNNDEIGLSEIVDSPVMVFNYLIKNSFEEKLRELLDQKGLYARNLFDNLKSETVSELILKDDWLSVFGMADNYKQNIKDERLKILDQLQAIDLEGLKSLMKSFFTFLGYRDISIMDIEDEPMFYIIGTTRHGTTPVNLHGKCCLLSDLKSEHYEEVIHLKQSSNEIKRKFVITTGIFAEKVANGTKYLDGADLANYILTLGIKSSLNKVKL